MKTNLLIATIIVIALSLWMTLGPMLAQAEDAEGSTPETKKLPQIRYRVSKAEPHQETISLRGRTRASQETMLKAELSGTIELVSDKRGQPVKKGEILFEIDPRDLPERIEAASAFLKQRELEFEAAKRLDKTGFQSETRFAEASFLLEQATADLSALQKALSYTKITAPYDGVFNDRIVQVGDFVSAGDPVASFLQLDPMIIEADATEIEIRKLSVGQEATAIIGGTEVQGAIRYLSRIANHATRSYPVEFEFANTGNQLSAGFTSDIQIGVSEKPAHFVSPSLLYLSASTDGELGLKVVNEKDEVAFFPTEVLSGERDGFWVSGLPDEVRLIVVGQGYVKPGTKVDPVDEATIKD